MSSNMFLVIRIKLVNQRELSFAPVNRSCFCITQFIAIISREFMLQRSCNRQIKLVKWIAISSDESGFVLPILVCLSHFELVHVLSFLFEPNRVSLRELLSVPVDRSSFRLIQFIRVISNKFKNVLLSFE